MPLSLLATGCLESDDTTSGVALLCLFRLSYTFFHEFVMILHSPNWREVGSGSSLEVPPLVI